MPILSAQASHTRQAARRLLQQWEALRFGRGTTTPESYWPELPPGLCHLPCVTSPFLSYRVGLMFVTPAS